MAEGDAAPGPASDPAPGPASSPKGTEPEGIDPPDPEAMRRLARAAVERVVKRWAGLRGEPAMALASRAEMEERLREPLPEEGRPLEEVLERFWSDVAPFAGRIDHPRFMAFIPSSPTFASLVGDWVTAGCNFFAGTWLESAGPSQVELVVLDWLKEALGCPEESGGIFTSGGSAANLMGLAVARDEALEGPIERGRVYCSDQTHTAVDRALRVLGLPAEALRKLPSDGSWRLEPGALAEAVAADRERGLSPFCVVANAGTTNTGAVDPLPELAALCRAEGLWLHVDGAYGAFGRLAAASRERLRGLEEADSLVLDPHKWLYVGYEAGCLLVRDPESLRRSFHVFPDYLQDTAPREREVNFADRGIQLTRRARAVKVWFSLTAHGRAGVAAAVERTVRLAEEAEERIRSEPSLELVSPASLGIVCFRHAGGPVPAGSRGAPSDEELDARNAAILERIQREGRFGLSSTRLDGRYVLRLCTMNYRVTGADVDAAIEEVLRVGDDLA